MEDENTTPAEDEPTSNIIRLEQMSRHSSRPNGAPDWLSRCQMTQNGSPRPNMTNILLGLKEDPAWQGVFAYDEMARCPVLLKPIPVHSRYGWKRDNRAFVPRALKDVDIRSATSWFQQAGIQSVGTQTIYDAVDVQAEELRFHPVRKYLDGLSWDGSGRLNDWLSRYLGVEDTAYSNAIGRWFMISMVARIFEPGCQVDHMMVLEGPQGVRKSTACRILAGKWFSDDMPPLDSKDASQHIRGKWLIEVAEMHSFSKAVSEALKAFLTRRVERYRPSYGRLEVQEPRSVVFIGTTNRDVYLRDDTGGRRFWPVKVGQIDTDALERDRDQLFAEATLAYREGEAWWPSDTFQKQHIEAEQEARFEADIWEERIENYLDEKIKNAGMNPIRVTPTDVAVNGLDFPQISKVGLAEQRRIGAVMRRAGWVPSRSNGRRFWVPPEPEVDTSGQ